MSLREENLNAKGMDSRTAKVKLEAQFIVVARMDGLIVYVAHLHGSSLEEVNLKLLRMKEKGGLSRYAHSIRDLLKILPNPYPNRPPEDFKDLEILPSSLLDKEGFETQKSSR